MNEQRDQRDPNDWSMEQREQYLEITHLQLPRGWPQPDLAEEFGGKDMRP